VTVVRNEVRRTREQNLAASRAMAAGALPGVLERLRAGPGKAPP